MGQVAYALLTRPPLSMASLDRSFIPPYTARLACVRHAASVQSEPESNSPVNKNCSVDLADQQTS